MFFVHTTKKIFPPNLTQGLKEFDKKRPPLIIRTRLKIKVSGEVEGR